MGFFFEVFFKKIYLHFGINSCSCTTCSFETVRYLILSASFIVTKEGSIGRWPALTHFPASTPLASGIIYASTLLGEASKEAPGTSDRCVNFRISLHNFEQTTPHYLIDNNVCFIHTK